MLANTNVTYLNDNSYNVMCALTVCKYFHTRYEACENKCVTHRIFYLIRAIQIELTQSVKRNLVSRLFVIAEDEHLLRFIYPIVSEHNRIIIIKILTCSVLAVL